MKTTHIKCYIEKVVKKHCLKGVFAKNERGYRLNAIVLILIFKINLAYNLFSNITGKYENVVFIIKNPRNRNKCFYK